MGALYIIAGMVLAGTVLGLVSAIAGESEVGSYDYHFATGVGAVFGTQA